MQQVRLVPLSISFLACAAALLVALAASVGCGTTPQGPALAEDEVTRDVYQRDCASGIGSACYELGESYVDGRWGPADDACGFAVLEKACEADYAGACARVGEMKAEGRGTPNDLAGATTLLRRACSDGSARACNDLGSLGRSPGPRTMGHAPTARAHTPSAVD